MVLVAIETVYGVATQLRQPMKLPTRLGQLLCSGRGLSVASSGVGCMGGQNMVRFDQGKRCVVKIVPLAVKLNTSLTGVVYLCKTRNHVTACEVWMRVGQVLRCSVASTGSV
jgi:hypothetical protein